jgi:hypothetical protein
MNRSVSYNVFGILGLIGFGTLSAQVSTTSCTIATLANYISSYGNNTNASSTSNGCSASTFSYYGFTFSTSSSSGNVDVSSNIVVSPDGSGLDFSGFQALVANSGDLEYFIGFDVDSTTPITIGSDSISLDPFNAGTATLKLYTCLGSTPYYLGDNEGAFECGSAYGDGFSPPTTSTINLASPSASATTASGTANFEFPAADQYGVLLELILNAGTTGTGDGTFENDPMAGPSAPEPATIVLVASALLAVLLVGKFHRRKLPAR